MKHKSKAKRSQRIEPQIRMVKLSALTPAPYNPRRISPEALKGLAISIKRWGLVEPVIVNRRGMRVVGGHQRLQVLRDGGAKECPCVLVDLPEAEEKALNVSLNNPRIQGEFTDDLGALLESIKLDLPELPADDLKLDELIDSLASQIADGDPAKQTAVPTIKSQFQILITCEDEQKQTDLLERFIQEGISCRALQS